MENRQWTGRGITGNRLVNNTNISPANFDAFFLLIISDTVYLQSNKTGLGAGIVKMGRRHTIDPRLDRIANSLNTELIPLVLLKRLAGIRIVFKIIQPTAAGLIINTSGISSVGRIDFNLVAVNTTTSGLACVPP